MNYLKSLTLLSFLLVTTLCWTQVSTSEINGVVKDATGAVVPGAEVSLKNPESGFVRSTVSNQTGNYVLTAIPPGNYQLRAAGKGFSTTAQDIVLEVGRAVTLNLNLKAGSATETINVTGEAPLVDTGRSELGGSVSKQEVQDLPLLSRNFANLTTLVPGVRPAQNF
jgi:hypothetical protein